MSFAAVQWALAQDVGKSATKFVLVAMASHVNSESSEMVCWPSYRALAAMTHQDTKTVEAAVSRLKQDCFIVDTGERRGDTRKVVVYRLNDPKSGVVTQGPQGNEEQGSACPNDPKTGGVQAFGNPPKFPPNPPKSPIESPQISGETTPKTGDGIRKGISNGIRKNKEFGCAEIPGVPPSLLSDWLQVRKDKRAGPLTATVIEGLTREAKKAGLTVESAVRYCCEAGWQGFNAGFHAKREGVTTPRSTPGKHRGFQTIDYSEGLTNGTPDA